MIFSTNKTPSFSEFTSFMAKVDQYLNADAAQREDYYLSRNGAMLEEDVASAMVACAKGTPFEGSITLVSGHKFPDIIANNYYGVEVKSSKRGWESTGSSIMEGTRIDGIERIYMTFGKLDKPVRFLSKPYEECLSDIAVTHSPRYKIDMHLRTGETVFDKIGIPYDTLRTLDNPIKPVSDYYRKRLKPGEALWWAPEQDPEEAVSSTVKTWNNLSKEEQATYISKAYALFPEITDPHNRMKYNAFGLWLVTQGIYHPNVRDSFTAGGKYTIDVNGTSVRLPATFKRIEEHAEEIALFIEQQSEDALKGYWRVTVIDNNRIRQWCGLVTGYNSSKEKQQHLTNSALNVIFKKYLS